MVQLKGNLMPSRRVAGLAGEGDISTGMRVARWDFSCIEQSLPVTSVGI